MPAPSELKPERLKHTQDQDELTKLGVMVYQMIENVQCTPAEDLAMCRRKITFPGGSVNLFIVRGDELADALNTAVEELCNVQDVTIADDDPSRLPS